MVLTPDDPSGYQRLIADERRRGLRGLLAFEVIGLTGLMLFFDRWTIYWWSFGLFAQLAFAVSSTHLRARKLGYERIADGNRRAVVETLAAFVVITAFVLVQSRFQLWFAQEPACYRFCPG